jgi:selenocysteine-specific elongation factor
MPHVIGTAGHVDHGKSALVLALTGTDPDRLAEEKARGMTIDLGFAWTTLPSGREVGFVDVPGHERFVHNMLAGVGGVDCALFVVDASEGWRPQSAEHLAILDLLGIATGVVALTKVDLVDEATRGLVATEVAARLAGTSLAGAPIIATAAPSGLGLDELRTALDQALDRVPEPPDRDRPRLAVDRVFSVRGSGTVVTGTLTGGTLAPELTAELFPAGQRVRIRALQSHGRPVTRAEPARRVAVNLAGIATDQVQRGDVLALPGQWAPTRVADCRLRCLPGAPAPLRARGAYLLYAGAAETAVRLQPLDAQEVRPGEDALVRLHLERPLVLDVLEPVVLRDSGRDETVGGGPVLDPFPLGQVHGTAARVRRAEELEAREAAVREPPTREAPGREAPTRGAPAREAPTREAPAREAPTREAPTREAPTREARGRDEAGPAAARQVGGRAAPDRVGLLERVLAERGATAVTALPRLVGVGPAVVDRMLAAAVEAGRVVRSRSLVWSRANWQAAETAVLRAVDRHHREEPLAPGLPAQAARQATKGGAEVVEALLADGRLVLDGPAVRLPEHGVRLDPRQQAVRARVETALAEGGMAVVGEQDLARLGANRPLIAVLARQGVLVAVAPGLYLGGELLDRAVATLRRAFPDRRAFTAAEAKEALGTTRKTAIPLLEHLDRAGVTLRSGDKRRLARPH